jgi:hypothetical protein
MAVYRGPRIVMDGLVLCLDAGDLNSCGGQPVTNLLTYTDSFSSTWGGYCGPTSNITFNTTAVTDPLGTNTAMRVIRGANTTCNSTEAWGLLYNPAVPILAAGGSYTVSFYARGASGGETLDFGLNDSHMTYNQSLTTTWTRYTYSVSGITDTSRGMQFRNTAGSCTYYVWGPQTVSGSAAGPYAASVGATNGTANLSWRDLSGGGYNATIVNSPLFTSGKISYFTCNNVQKFTISNPLNQTATGQLWTVIAWVNIDTVTGANARYLISGLNLGLSVEWYDVGPLLYLNSGANDYYSYGSNIEGSGWVMLSFVFRNSDGYRKIFRNLTDITTAGGPNNTSTPSGQSATFTIADNMRGKIASLLIYNRVLSTAELKQNFDAVKTKYGY